MEQTHSDGQFIAGNLTDGPNGGHIVPEHSRRREAFSGRSSAASVLQYKRIDETRR